MIGIEGNRDCDTGVSPSHGADQRPSEETDEHLEEDCLNNGVQSTWPWCDLGKRPLKAARKHGGEDSGNKWWCAVPSFRLPAGA